MKIFTVCPDSFGANTYLIISDGSAFAIDPAVSVSALDRVLEANNARLCGVLLTHGHFDHTISVDTLRDKHNAPLMMSGDDAEMLSDGKLNGFFDFYGKTSTHRNAEKLVCDGDVLHLGNEQIKVIATPGHSKGSLCFECPDENGKAFLITGDTLFASSVGRTDLHGGDEKTLALSLAKLSALPCDTVIYPGHGASSSLGYALNVAKYYIDF